MSNLLCAYTGNREDALVGYLYDDVDPIERATFDAHLGTCGRCRAELADLSGVRRQLGTWAPPVYGGLNHQSPVTTLPQSWWREIPAWAQVAAAVLVLGAAAGFANVDVRYNKDGLTVRTGWMKPDAGADARLTAARSTEGKPRAATANVASTTEAVSTAATSAKGDVALKSDTAPWRADLAALEQQLRSEFRAADAQTVRSVALRSASGGAGVNDAEVLRRVNAVVDESERRQKNELALQIAQVWRDVKAQRNADLARINQSLGAFSQDAGVAIMKNQQKVDYLLRVAQTK